MNWFIMICEGSMFVGWYDHAGIEGVLSDCWSWDQVEHSAQLFQSSLSDVGDRGK